MSTERVVWLDPGGTTGWAYWQDVPHPNMESAPQWQYFSCGQIGPEEHHAELYDWLLHLYTHKFTLGSESFEFRKGDHNRHGISLISREYIGVAKLFVKQNLVPSGQQQSTLVLQTAAQAKSFVTDEKLKVMGMWIPGQGHAMDAMRHLITYLVQKRGRVDLIESWKRLT